VPAQSEFLSEVDGHQVITPAGKEWLANILTSTEGQVYAFTQGADPVTVAAAMARLSRRAGDMRVALLDEFAGDPADAPALIQRVVTEYGDDSVQQLITVQFVMEGASNLLTKLLEWGRIGAAYLEQSTRYIYFDQKGPDGKFLYFTPGSLEPALMLRYESDMDTIFGLYSEVVRRVTDHVRSTNPRPDKAEDPDGHKAWPAATRAQACDAARPLLPVATRSTVGFAMSAQAVDALIMRLLAHDLPEAQQAGRDILEQVQQIIPAFLERTSRPDRGGMTVDYLAGTKSAMTELAASLLPDDSVWDGQAVRLTDYWPQNELELAAPMMFDLCGLPLSRIRDELARRDDHLRVEKQILATYMGERLNRRHRPGRALEQAHFSWELVGDYGTFRDLQRHRMVDDLRWQPLHPHFGFEVPELVTQAGCEDLFRQAFEVADLLYTVMATSHPVEAQYATLLGHRMRYQFTTNLRELFHMLELRTSPQGHPGYRKLCLGMFRDLEHVYPRMAAAMEFVNQADNLDELTRMASERATAGKLAELDGENDS
jgi:thymidylate synthase ThyX